MIWSQDENNLIIFIYEALLSKNQPEYQDNGQQSCYSPLDSEFPVDYNMGQLHY